MRHLFMLTLCCLAGALLPAQTPRPQIFVDAVNGNDLMGNGTLLAPYQTITHTLT